MNASREQSILRSAELDSGMKRRRGEKGEDEHGERALKAISTVTCEGRYEDGRGCHFELLGKSDRSRGRRAT